MIRLKRLLAIALACWTLFIQGKSSTGFERMESIPADSFFCTIIETNPEFPGGSEACMKFIADNLRYPPEALKKDIEGRVYVCFIVDSLGYIKDPEVVRSTSPLLNEEALRLVRSMPQPWRPGTRLGKPITVKFSLPVMFRIEQYKKHHPQAQPPKP